MIKGQFPTCLFGITEFKEYLCSYYDNDCRCTASALLFAVSRLTQRRSTNETFFRAERRSPWYMVAFDMVPVSRFSCEEL